jgi:thiopeptide-type bacteriocin biosynthesis protein
MPPDRLRSTDAPLAGRLDGTVHAAGDWWQLYIEFTDWPGAEMTAASHLLPLLRRWQEDGSITAWWYIRKHPCWRLRLAVPADATGSPETKLGEALNDLISEGHIRRWWPGLYEPETAAFGGPFGMRTAHELFHADSCAALAHHQRSNSALGRRELSVLLCTVFMRAAGLEWYELGDVWHRVAEERPLSAAIPADRLNRMAENLRLLMLADTGADGPLLGEGGAIASAAGWADAFRRAGRALGAAACEGTLERGLRQILAYHVVFHWNRLGLSARAQGALAWAARTAVLGEPASA